MTRVNRGNDAVYDQSIKDFFHSKKDEDGDGNPVGTLYQGLNDLNAAVARIHHFSPDNRQIINKYTL